MANSADSDKHSEIGSATKILTKDMNDRYVQIEGFYDFIPFMHHCYMIVMFFQISRCRSQKTVL